jgi:hypothetical protein
MYLKTADNYFYKDNNLWYIITEGCYQCSLKQVYQLTLRCIQFTKFFISTLPSCRFIFLI